VLGSDLHKDSGSSTLRVAGGLIFADGFLAARTAALREPYSDDPNTSGKLQCASLQMERSATRILQANLHLIIHAMGDLAVETALDVIDAVAPSFGIGLVCRLEQAALLDEKLIQRIKQQNVVVSMQPRVVESEFSVWSAIKHLGNKRAKWLYPMQTLLKEGIRVIGGSDCPMEPLNPLLGIQAAVTRENFPEQRITVDDALQIYTINSANSSLEASMRGSIEVGKLADFTVLSHDPHLVSPTDIGRINVEMTIVEGKVVHTKSP
jgi:predicted amidohydrolase YtcJ